MRYIKRDISLFLLSTLLAFSSCRNSESPGRPAAQEEAKEISTTRTSSESTAQTGNIPVKEITFKDISLGVSSDSIRRIFDKSALILERETFGKLSTDVQYYETGSVKWWGLEGDLSIEFSEQTGISVAIIWTSYFTTRSDFNTLVKIISKEIPEAAQSGGSGEGVNYKYLVHTWEAGNKSYSLLWYDISTGKMEFTMPSTLPPKTSYQPD